MNNRFASQPKTSFILNRDHVDNIIEVLTNIIDQNKNRHCTVSINKDIFIDLPGDGGGNRVMFPGSRGGLIVTAGHFEKII